MLLLPYLDWGSLGQLTEEWSGAARAVGFRDLGCAIWDLGCAMWGLEIRDLEFGTRGLVFGMWVH